MLFTTATFVFLYLPTVLLGYFLLGRRSGTLAAAWLFTASVFFYGDWMPAFTLLLVGSIAVNFAVGGRIGQALAGVAPGHRPVAASRWLTAGIVFNLGLLAGSGNTHSRCLDPAKLQPRTERQPPPSTLKRWARHRALAQYLFGQFKLQPMVLLRSMFVRTVPADPPSLAAVVAARPLAPLDPGARRLVDTAVERLFADAGPHLRGRLLFVIDGRRDGSGEVQASDDLERLYLKERPAANGAAVIDLEPLFAQHARRSARKLDVGPCDEHLNALGVALAIQPVADWLRNEAEPARWRTP